MVGDDYDELVFSQVASELYSYYHSPKPYQLLPDAVETLAELRSRNIRVGKIRLGLNGASCKTVGLFYYQEQSQTLITGSTTYCLVWASLSTFTSSSPQRTPGAPNLTLKYSTWRPGKVCSLTCSLKRFSTLVRVSARHKTELNIKLNYNKYETVCLVVYFQLVCECLCCCRGRRDQRLPRSQTARLEQLAGGPVGWRLRHCAG